MTEKRFTLTFDDKIVDNLTGIIHDVYSGYDVAMDLSGLLNEQHEKIQQQKEAIEHLSYDCEYLENNFEDKCKENEQLKKENKFLRCTIESNSQDDYIDYLEKQNERLKERITELASNDKIVFMNGQNYEIF